MTGPAVERRDPTYDGRPRDEGLDEVEAGVPSEDEAALQPAVGPGGQGDVPRHRLHRLHRQVGQFHLAKGISWFGRNIKGVPMRRTSSEMVTGEALRHLYTMSSVDRPYDSIDSWQT